MSGWRLRRSVNVTDDDDDWLRCFGVLPRRTAPPTRSGNRRGTVATVAVAHTHARARAASSGTMSRVSKNSKKPRTSPTDEQSVAPRLDFTFRLSGRGWAEAAISDGTNTTSMAPSFLSDALGDLLRAVNRVLAGAREAECTWQEEPGVDRWHLVREEDRVVLRVFAVDDDVEGETELVFQTRQTLPALGDAFLRGAQAVLDHYGTERYRNTWVEHPFPTEELELLRRRLQHR
ncbi:hypothetical protein Q760_15965 [Cellulomonas cellasea DSM 20118]|uniref:Uncharacterized protein n=1 Tax=Cellulomonas cellasea DSM 20118 TaxID=1408250 RepID=A0A0A0B7A3_9CELL|nr:hypothetical protein Q760_15965 [Cellulomonas cellasea DSM 20118]